MGTDIRNLLRTCHSISSILTHTEQYINGCKRAYAVIVKLCPSHLMTRLEGKSGFTGVKDGEYLVGLIILFQGIC